MNTSWSSQSAMTPKHCGASSPNEFDDAGDAFELLQHRRTPSTRQISTLKSKKNMVDDWAMASTPRLPAKHFTFQSTRRIVHILFWTGLLGSLIIGGLSTLATLLQYFLPYRNGLDFKHSLSCDLNYEQGDKIQNAFTINLRGAAHLTFTQARAIASSYPVQIVSLFGFFSHSRDRSSTFEAARKI